MRQSASFEPSTIKIGSVVFAVCVPEKKKIKKDLDKSQQCYISPPRGAAPTQQILFIFGMFP
jgi:hypothetical protein